MSVINRNYRALFLSFIFLVILTQTVRANQKVCDIQDVCKKVEAARNAGTQKEAIMGKIEKECSSIEHTECTWGSIIKSCLDNGEEGAEKECETK